MVGDGRLGEVEERHELADADLAGVLSQDVDQLHADRIAQGLRDHRHALRLVPMNVGIDNRLAARLAGRSLLLRNNLQIDGHLYTYID